MPTRAEKAERVQAKKASPRESRRSRKVREDKAKFLISFAQRGVITHACNETGVSRSSVYEWQEFDDDFGNAFRVALEASTERFESEAIKRAIEGVVVRTREHVDKDGNVTLIEQTIEYSDSLLALLLRARKPSVYRERPQPGGGEDAYLKAYAGIDPDRV